MWERAVLTVESHEDGLLLLPEPFPRVLSMQRMCTEKNDVSRVADWTRSFSHEIEYNSIMCIELQSKACTAI